MLSSCCTRKSVSNGLQWLDGVAVGCRRTEVAYPSDVDYALWTMNPSPTPA